MITIADIKTAQENWIRAIIRIGSLKGNRTGVKVAADHMMDKLYAFEMGDVLFKPTKTSDAMFRKDRRGAVSFFIGDDPAYPEDEGFALHPWKKINIKNAGVNMNKNIAMAMGTYTFHDGYGRKINAEYTFGYVNAGSDGLKINLHHSSLPDIYTEPKHVLERRSTKVDMLYGSTDYRISY